MPQSPIRRADDAGIATITLDRPNVMNGLDAATRRDLLAAITAAGATARVVVLTGAGRGFCSGQDLAEIPDIGTADLGRVLDEEYVPLLRAIADCPVPVIAAVNGPAAGAGASLALAADVVIAAESAIFIQAFARIGLVPDAGATYWLPRQIGFARAMGACLFAEPITARQAADWGLIWQAVPDADFPAAVRARAEQLASGPTGAYRLIRRALRASLANDLDAQLALESDLQRAAGQGTDFREGVAAFLEKRAPRFTGH